MKTKIVLSHTANSKPVKQEVNSIVTLPPLVFPGFSLLVLYSQYWVCNGKLVNIRLRCNGSSVKNTGVYFVQSVIDEEAKLTRMFVLGRVSLVVLISAVKASSQS